MKKSVVIVEMGLRDGLQNEKKFWILTLALNLQDDLSKPVLSGWRSALLFLLNGFHKWQEPKSHRKNFALVKSGTIPKKQNFLFLFPTSVWNARRHCQRNQRSRDLRSVLGVLFFSKNINCSIDESFKRFEPVMALAKNIKIKVRGYLSTCFGCPFEGKVPEARGD